ncbi:uncharacterized protein LOC144427395 [Styela clava]
MISSCESLFRNYFLFMTKHCVNLQQIKNNKDDNIERKSNREVMNLLEEKYRERRQDTRMKLPSNDTYNNSNSTKSNLSVQNDEYVVIKSRSLPPETEIESLNRKKIFQAIILSARIPRCNYEDYDDEFYALASENTTHAEKSGNGNNRNNSIMG